MIEQVVNQIIPWIINNILKIIKYKKRDENLWIFGAWGGDDYSDNSKYVFEYVSENLPNIRAVWITKNKEVKNIITNQGYKCYLYNESSGRKVRLNAKYVFYTNGITDIGKYDLSHGSVKIALWHGMPLKKLMYATNNIQRKNKNILRLAQYFILKIYNNNQRNITIATSETTKDLLMRCFEVKPETVLITGQPRNDGLFNTDHINSLKKKLYHKSGHKFVLYMPTWREIGGNEDFLNRILLELYSDSLFLDSLVENNIILYIKPHPRITVNVRSTDNIIILQGISDFDTQELIGAADVLITDYSSVFIDYALLERPVHFFVPDLHNYKNDRLGLFFEFNDFADYWFTELETFKSIILNDNNSCNLGINNAIKVNSIFNDPSLTRGQFTRTFIETFLKLSKNENSQNK